MAKRIVAKAKKEVQAFLNDYPDAEFAGAQKAEDGTTKLIFRPRLAVLAPEEQPALARDGRHVPPEIRVKQRAIAEITYRDALIHSDLDLAKPDITSEHPKKIYNRIFGYYRSMDVFGSYIDVKADLAVSGFENDCEDMAIKEFYDNWCQDVDLEQVLEWIYHEFFTSGLVRTYKVVGRYEPQVNTLSEVKKPPQPATPKRQEGEDDLDYKLQRQMWLQGQIPDYIPEAENLKEYAARKKRWSKGFIPIAYTVLNPRL